MALALLTTGSGVAFGTRTEIEYTADAGRSVGDGEVAVLWSSSTGVTPTVANWTALGNGTQGTGLKAWFYGRICDGTSKDNFKATFSSMGCLGEMRRLTGGPAEVAKWVLGTAEHGSSKELKFLAATSTAANSLAVGLAETETAAEFESITAGWTHQGTNALFTGKEALLGNGESTGSPVWKIKATNAWVTLLVVIPPKEEAAAAQAALSMVI